jgi:two-component system, OmpR family, KDP operon response regulator KdpE
LAGRGPRALVIDDDPAVRLLLRRELTAAGYRVWAREPSPAALASIAESRMDLLILDIDAAAIGGADAIRSARKASPVPIIAVSARSNVDATVVALEKGADDCIRKPFSTDELLARANNALRRRALEVGRPTELVNGDLEIDLLHDRVRLRGCAVQLPVKPYEVLRVLAESTGRVVTHQEILRAVWDQPTTEHVGYVRVAVRTLRRILEEDSARPRYILTEPGLGYRLEVRHRDAGGAPHQSADQAVPVLRHKRGF